MKIFIGSSSKHLHIAEKVALIIEEFKHEPILWKNSFIASDWTFERLMQICHTVNAGIFILAPDDKITDGENKKFITRDNVLIEAGMFSGKLGKSYVALCKLPETTVPSDFHGITFINYTDSNYFEFRKQLSDWIGAMEKSIDANNNTIFLQDSLPNFKEVVLSAHKEIMMSSFFMSIAQISKELNDAISHGLNVRFLLPDFWGKNWMATVALLDGVGDDGKRAKRKLEGTLLWLAEKAEKGYVPDNFKIRLIDCVFPTRMTIVDPDTQNGHMYVHINSYINRFGNNTTFNLTKQQPWFEIYKQEFENMWEDARPVDFNEIKSAFDP